MTPPTYPTTPADIDRLRQQTQIHGFEMEAPLSRRIPPPNLPYDPSWVAARSGVTKAAKSYSERLPENTPVWGYCMRRVDGHRRLCRYVFTPLGHVEFYALHSTPRVPNDAGVYVCSEQHKWEFMVALEAGWGRAVEALYPLPSPTPALSTASAPEPAGERTPWLPRLRSGLSRLWQRLARRGV